MKYLDIPEDIKDYLNYNPDTGELTWVRKPSNRVNIGSLAGCTDHEGYKAVRFCGKTYRCARVCYFLYHNKQPKTCVDHKNRDRSDNRISNLRLATDHQNSVNTTGFGKSKFRGVHYRTLRGSWVAICDRGYIGSSLSEKEAALMYNYRAKQLYGNFAYFNQVFEDVPEEVVQKEYGT